MNNDECIINIFNTLIKPISHLSTDTDTFIKNKQLEQQELLNSNNNNLNNNKGKSGASAEIKFSCLRCNNDETKTKKSIKRTGFYCRRCIYIQNELKKKNWFKNIIDKLLKDGVKGVSIKELFKLYITNDTSLKLNLLCDCDKLYERRGKAIHLGNDKEPDKYICLCDDCNKIKNNYESPMKNKEISKGVSKTHLKKNAEKFIDNIHNVYNRRLIKSVFNECRFQCSSDPDICQKIKDTYNTYTEFQKIGKRNDNIFIQQLFWNKKKVEYQMNLLKMLNFNQDSFEYTSDKYTQIKYIKQLITFIMGIELKIREKKIDKWSQNIMNRYKTKLKDKEKIKKNISHYIKKDPELVDYYTNLITNIFNRLIPIYNEYNRNCNQGETKLYNYLIENYPEYEWTREKSFPWCVTRGRNCQLKFDFVSDKFKIIIELDGKQHQLNGCTRGKRTFKEKYYDSYINIKQYEIDVERKEKSANENGYKVIRVCQNIVAKDKPYNKDNNITWQSKLDYELKETNKIVSIIYPPEYKWFRLCQGLLLNN